MILFKRTRTFFFIAISAILLISCTNKAEEKNYLLGIVNPNPKLEKTIKSFKAAMASNGYEEGKNISYYSIFKQHDIDLKLPELIKQNPDLILTFTTPGTKKTLDAVRGTNIPVLFGILYDPLEGGIIDDLVNKKENITGVKVAGSVQKALEWLPGLKPGIKNVFVPIKFDTQAARLSLAELSSGAEKLGINLQIAEVEDKAQLTSALSAIPANTEAMFILNSILIVSNIDEIVSKATMLNIPIGSNTGQIDRGVTITYGQDSEYTGKQAARLAHKILMGAPASGIPIETAHFKLGINLKKALEIGLTVPDNILQMADIVVR
ncbi:MAG: ABC transporter substrate-binding protein [Nitrospira sp.]|nr:ABC transporter substrate-binding protein [bacterium]MBL7048204.1 ABC transporter substrate-binding protein [Nitrospira sp.]